MGRREQPFRLARKTRDQNRSVSFREKLEKFTKFKFFEFRKLRNFSEKLKKLKFRKKNIKRFFHFHKTVLLSKEIKVYFILSFLIREI